MQKLKADIRLLITCKGWQGYVYVLNKVAKEILVVQEESQNIAHACMMKE